MTQSRWKSKLMWASLAAQLTSILLIVGALTADQVNVVMLVVAGVLEMLTTLGVINSPTTKGAL